jgi:hypothetical protein
MRNEALFEHRSTPASQPELKATVRSEQIKALYHPPAIMLVSSDIRNRPRGDMRI